ncbi:hypothetical protein D6C79_03351 [Aureobasidium pullulans]|nr:hypothetical protein D6C79_03351 [Aureobasidium pullulans]
MSTIFVPPAKATIQRNATLLTSLAAAFTALTTVSFILRVWARTKIVRCWGKDDWVMLATQWANNEASLTSAQSLDHFVEVSQNNKFHVAMSPLTSQKSYNLLLVSNATYLITILLLKVSLALFFLRFIIERWARLTIWGITIFHLVWTFAVLLVSVFYCGNPTDILTKTMEGGKCISERTTLIIGVTWGISNVVTDWFFALLPITFLLRSRLPRTTKISAVIVMMIAVVGSCTAIPRISTYKDLHGSNNYWTTSARFLTWSIVEPGVGLLAANTATLRPVLDRLMEACVSGRGVVEVEQGVNKININAEKCDSHSEGTEPKSDISASGMYSDTSISSVPPPWETELEFVKR